MSNPHDSDRLAAWTEAELGLEGRVLEVVRAPDPVLATAGRADRPDRPRVGPAGRGPGRDDARQPRLCRPRRQQVGIAAQIFCVDVSTHPKARTHHGTFVLCNAEVVEASRNDRAREGCMSVPDFTGDVKRASRLVVTGQLPGTGEQVTITTDAFEARALQHEMDHCQGFLFLDRVAGAHAVHPRQTYL